MEVKVVLGTLWGDCGKGATVQWLCKKALDEGKKPCVIRFSGGPQSGHTVKHNGVTHICSSYGSGVLLGVPTFYIPTAFVDPLCLINEREELIKKGITPPQIMFDDQVSLITPYDVCNQFEWSQNYPHQSCNKGVWPTIERRWTVDYREGSSLENFLCDVSEYYEHKYNIDPAIRKRWLKAADEVCNFPFITMSEIRNRYDVLIYESTQGLGLDRYYGNSNMRTSTHVGLNNVYYSDLINSEIYFVSRSYLTRHGAMGREEQWFKKELNIVNPFETNVYNDAQGEFKTAEWNAEPYKEVIINHDLSRMQRKYGLRYNIVVTCLDLVERLSGPIPSSIPKLIKATFEAKHVVINNVYTSDNPYSNFKLYDCNTRHS